MAWTHFTAPLAEGEELTLAMWYELCEALAERLIASQQAVQVDLTEAAAIAAAGILPKGVPVRVGGGALELMAWTTVLSGSVSWAANTTTPNYLSTSAGSSYTTATEWGAEGLSEAQWSALKTAVALGWNDRRYWNIIRATIQRLQIVVRDRTSATRYSKVVDSSVDWADAVSLYDAEPESVRPGGGGFASVEMATSLYLGIEWRIINQREEINYAAAATEAMESVEAWSFWELQIGYSSPPTDTIDWVIGGAAASVAMSNTYPTSPRFDLGTGLDLSAAFTLDVRLGSYDAISPFEPDIATAYNNRISYATTLFLAPAWTKP